MQTRRMAAALSRFGPGLNDDLLYVILGYVDYRVERTAACISRQWARLRRAWLVYTPKQTTTCAFSPDGRMVFAAGENSNVKCIDVATGRVRREIEQRLDIYVDEGSVGWHMPGQKGYIWSCAVSNDSCTLAVCCDNQQSPPNAAGAIGFYDIASGVLRHEYDTNNAVEAVVFSVPGLVAICERNEIRLYDSYSTQTGLPPPRHILRHGRTILGAAFSPDGSLFAVGGWDEEFPVAWFNAATGSLCRGVKRPGTVFQVAFSTDGRTLAAGGRSGNNSVTHTLTGRVALCDVATGALRHELRPIECVFTVAFSGDGVYLAVGGYKNVALYDAKTYAPRRVIPFPGQVRNAVFSPDSSALALGCYPKMLALYDPATGNLRRATEDCLMASLREYRREHDSWAHESDWDSDRDSFKHESDSD